MNVYKSFFFVGNVTNDFAMEIKLHYEATVTTQWIIWVCEGKRPPEDLSQKSLCVGTMAAAHGCTFRSSN